MQSPKVEGLDLSWALAVKLGGSLGELNCPNPAGHLFNDRHGSRSQKAQVTSSLYTPASKAFSSECALRRQGFCRLGRMCCDGEGTSHASLSSDTDRALRPPMEACVSSLSRERRRFQADRTREAREGGRGIGARPLTLPVSRRPSSPPPFCQVEAWTSPGIPTGSSPTDLSPSSTAGLIGGDTAWLYPQARVGLQPCARLSKELRAAAPWTPVNSGLRPTVHLTWTHYNSCCAPVTVPENRQDFTRLNFSPLDSKASCWPPNMLYVPHHTIRWSRQVLDERATVQKPGTYRKIVAVARRGRSPSSNNLVSSIKANTSTDHPSSSSAKMRFATLFQCLVVALIQGESAFARSDTCPTGRVKMCEEQSGTKFILSSANNNICPEAAQIKCCSYDNPGTFNSQKELDNECKSV
ncbi:uncharacterized protein PGTG_01477 [Puccinia graminis f. sp. tritici CRL 75-36-700-3]|uniref:Uncharacterized protein n=2 Tax=Puccinia graminis f. sp. tritici TaxID=56615 RepID=E3JS13_PUCGT|nr:uncharacterized protein PGTG_01477 [Puccinia graminis f. sp. tritici CRL 75-36-700-3]EFP74884.2 hypothetical protein PGTG_01477 [Puccinia graminis f. sp. tritici CRL 75-36-700-3]